MPYLSASEVVIHYEEALYQVYAPLPSRFALLCPDTMPEAVAANEYEIPVMDAVSAHPAATATTRDIDDYITVNFDGPYQPLDQTRAAVNDYDRLNDYIG